MKQHIQTGTILALIIGGLVLAGVLMVKLSALIVLVLIAIVLSESIDPMVVWLQKATGRRLKLKLKRGAATLLVLLFGMLIILGIAALVITTAVKEAINFAQNSWPSLLNDKIIPWAEWMVGRYNLNLKPETLLSQLSGQSKNIADYLWTTTQAVFGFIGGLFSVMTIFILTFFFTSARAGIAYMVLQFVPARYQQRVKEVSHLAGIKMGGWLRGQLVLALIVTVVTSLAMWPLGIGYPMLIGIVGGVGELIPMVGPYLAFFPAILLAAASGSLWKMIAVFIFFGLLSQTENYILAPRVMKSHVQLSPVTTIMAIFAGGTLFGLVGALLAIPLAAAGRVILLEAVFPAIQGISAREIEMESPEARELRAAAQSSRISQPPPPPKKPAPPAPGQAKRRRGKATAG